MNAPSQYGSPELQDMILEDLTGKAREAGIETIFADAIRYLKIRNADMDMRNRIEHYSGPALDFFLDTI